MHTWCHLKNKGLVAPSALTYLQWSLELFFTFSTSSPKPLIMWLSDFTKILSIPLLPKFVRCMAKLLKMASWRHFEYRFLRLFCSALIYKYCIFKVFFLQNHWSDFIIIKNKCAIWFSWSNYYFILVLHAIVIELNTL